MTMKRKKVIIMGAAGRDFHNFNMYFRDNEAYEVVAFTATQIPNIDDRRYPSELAGKLYPKGIPIHPEEELSQLIKRQKVEQVVFAYSDISHVDLMHKGSLVLASGADFRLMGNRSLYLESKVPVISVCAVRTGSGKSPATRKICAILKEHDRCVVAIRHPMPYGDLVKQRVQRFATYADLDKHDCTIEEREEYEPLIDKGIIVYAGVDYEAILRLAEGEADVIVWDGGNNDLPFIHSNLHIVIADPLRAGHESLYHPGEANVRMADVIIINKAHTADRKDILAVRENVHRMNPRALIIEAASPISVERPDMVRGKRVLVVEDGPTVTHGGMAYGAGHDRSWRTMVELSWTRVLIAVGSIAETYVHYPHLREVLPAMGYGEEQVRELEETINGAECDVVVSGTPVDLRRVIKVNKPIIRVRYEMAEIGHPDLREIIEERIGILLAQCENDHCGIR